MKPTDETILEATVIFLDKKIAELEGRVSGLRTALEIIELEKDIEIPIGKPLTETLDVSDASDPVCLNEE